MDTDQEIKKIIDEYVKKIEDKEEALTFFKNEIEKILSESKEDLANITASLDVKFDDNSISEEEYLTQLREEKEKILTGTKNKLSFLIQNLSANDN